MISTETAAAAEKTITMIETTVATGITALTKPCAIIGNADAKETSIMSGTGGATAAAIADPRKTTADLR